MHYSFMNFNLCHILNFFDINEYYILLYALILK